MFLVESLKRRSRRGPPANNRLGPQGAGVRSRSREDGRQGRGPQQAAIPSTGEREGILGFNGLTLLGRLRQVRLATSI